MSLLGKLAEGLMAQGERLRSKPLVEATMASAALIASANGTVTFAKRNLLDQIIDNVEDLRNQDSHTTIEIFNSFADEIRFQPEQGQRRALKCIAAVAGESEHVEVVLKTAWALSRADGAPTDAEQRRIQDVASALRVPADSANLGSNNPSSGAKEFLGIQNHESRPDMMGSPKDPHRSSGSSPSTDISSFHKTGVGPTIIAIGNEKGGTGKSTAAVHLAVALLKQGYRVGTLDLDGRQATFTHYLANRKAQAEKQQEQIVIPRHHRIQRSNSPERVESERQERSKIRTALSDFADMEFVVIDTPGHDCYLTRLGHTIADILITPLNDSFVDVDVLAKIDREKRQVLGPSPYCEQVWQENDRRILDGRPPLQWIVMRNRLAQLNTRNNREMQGLLRQLGDRMGFQIQPGLSERVVYRELFFQGLTVLDFPQDDLASSPSWSHARQEMNELFSAVVSARNRLDNRSGGVGNC